MNEPAMLTPLQWAERALLGVGAALGLWALLSSAQIHFYASLPVPTAPVALAELPGEGPDRQVGGANERSRLAVRPGSWLARLEAPSVGLTATVIEGSTNDMLARAAGHIEQTALPGQPGNVGIAGHRDTTFRAVRLLKVGDHLQLTTADGAFTYEVDRLFVVDPNDVHVLDPTTAPSLTLVTCYPFTFIGHAPKRFIVRATLVR
jgi:sortase A